MKIRSIFLSASLFAAFGANTANAAEGLCLGNICVGDKLSAATAKWDSVADSAPFDTGADRHTPDKAGEIYPKASGAQSKLVAENLSGFYLKVDSDMLAQIADLQPVCRMISVLATKASDSGYVTKVVFQPKNGGDRIGDYRVVEIRREWNIPYQKQDALLNDLRGRYGDIPEKQPYWQYEKVFAHGSPATLWLREKGLPSVDDADFANMMSTNLASNPQCPKRNSP